MSLKSKILVILFFLLISVSCWGRLQVKGRDLTHNEKGHIFAQLTCQAPLREANKDNYIDQSSPFFKDHFCPREDVWVRLYPGNVGHDNLNQHARLYVIPFHEGILDYPGNNFSLEDVTGDGYETSVIQPGGDRDNYIKIWNKPVCSCKEYIVVVDFSPFGTYNKGRDILDKKLDLNAPWICLESISFNHDPLGNGYDALNIRMNKDEEVHVPEWDRGGRAYPAAYIKNRSITVKTVFSASPDVRSAVIYASEVSGMLGGIMPETVVFKNGNPNEAEFQCSLKTPKEIRSFYQGWIWYCKAINGRFLNPVPVGSSKNKIFTVLNEPQDPWNRTGQSEPWVDVLEYSCLWADGEINPEGAATGITHNLYNKLGCVYQTCSWFTEKGCNSFYLSGFMSRIPDVRDVNCYDMGKALVTFANILGCGLSYNLSRHFGKLNCVSPVGQSRECCKNLLNHAFGTLGDNVFDSCLKVDSGTQPAQWLTNLSWSEYKRKVIKEGSPGDPQPFYFLIDGVGNKFLRISETPLEFVKEKYQFSKWPGETGKIIPGITISDKTIQELQGMTKKWKKDIYCLETIQNETYLNISQWWQSRDKQFLATMVVGRTWEAAKHYLILHYANTHRNPPLIKRPGKEFGLCIGTSCFVAPAARKGSFSTIDFIRRNVIIMLEAKGHLTVNLKEIAKRLDQTLQHNDTKKCFEELGTIPRITEFSCPGTPIKLGDTIPLKLEVRKSGYREIHHYWKMTGGGVERDSGGKYVYYGGELGKHTIMVTTMTELGLYDKSKPLEITVEK